MPGERRPRAPRAPRQRRPAAPTSWDELATWYNGWVGELGSEYHRAVAVPTVLKLLAPRPGERILDVGAGQGVLAPPVARAGAHYSGVDASPRLISLAKSHHGTVGRFLVGDARRLTELPGIEAETFDAVVFLLSLQDMDPLVPVIAGAARVLRPNGRAILLLTHPAFRVPRQSGWGWDEGRKLVYRRVDRYLTPLPVPMKPLPGQNRATRSFHRPLQDYVNALGDEGLLLDHMDEVLAHKMKRLGAGLRAEEMARNEIPLFLAIRAWKVRPQPGTPPSL
jgi:ubiquinone/menaquinone biosynthesis C-methylase UbiE